MHWWITRAGPRAPGTHLGSAAAAGAGAGGLGGDVVHFRRPTHVFIDLHWACHAGRARWSKVRTCPEHPWMHARSREALVREQSFRARVSARMHAHNVVHLNYTRVRN